MKGRRWRNWRELVTFSPISLMWLSIVTLRIPTPSISSVVYFIIHNKQNMICQTFASNSRYHPYRKSWNMWQVFVLTELHTCYETLQQYWRSVFHIMLTGFISIKQSQFSTKPNISLTHFPYFTSHSLSYIHHLTTYHNHSSY